MSVVGGAVKTKLFEKFLLEPIDAHLLVGLWLLLLLLLAEIWWEVVWLRRCWWLVSAFFRFLEIQKLFWQSGLLFGVALCHLVDLAPRCELLRLSRSGVAARNLDNGAAVAHPKIVGLDANNDAGAQPLAHPLRLRAGDASPIKYLVAHVVGERNGHGALHAASRGECFCQAAGVPECSNAAASRRQQSNSPSEISILPKPGLCCKLMPRTEHRIG